MLDKLFESLDEKVFTPKLKSELQVQFNEAVEMKADEMAADRIEEELETLNVKSEEHIETLNEQTENRINELDAKAEEFVEMKLEEMQEQVEKYLDLVVEEFVQESKEALEESTKSEQADMIVEAFESMMIATGVKVSDIVEARDETSSDAQLSESEEKYDTLIDAHIALQEQNNTLIKMGVIKELSESLSLIESEKFERLASLVEFSADEAYVEKLEVIKESVKGSKAKVVEPEPQTSELTESNAFDKSYAHLI